MSWAAVAVGVGTAAGGMLGKSRGSTTSTSSNEPWGVAQPHIANNLGMAEAMIRSPNQYQTQSTGLLAQRALQGNPLNQAAQQNNLQTLQGSYLSPDSNPYLKDTVNEAMNGVRSQINGQFAGDNYGSSAHQEWLTKGLMGAAAPMYSQNYQQERQRQLGAQALAPTLANQDYTDIGQLQAAGNVDWDQLMKYNQIAQGAGGMGGNQSQSQPYFQNQAAGMMGGALGGLSLYNGMNQGGLTGAPLQQGMVPGQYSLMNPQYG